MKNLFKFGTLGLVLLLSGCEAVSVPTSNTPAAQSYSNQHLLMQKGVDYRFSDYHNFDTSDVYQCQRSCNSDGQCQAYTWTVPGFQSASGKCWLKNFGDESRPQTQPCPECISGISSHYAQRMSRSQVAVPNVVGGQVQRQQSQIGQRTNDEVNRRIDGAVNRVLDGIFGK